MTDITKCENVACPLRKRCYRAQAPSAPLWQPYAMFHYVDGKCDNFLEIFKVKEGDGKS
jgi:hypothetical protein